MLRRAMIPLKPSGSGEDMEKLVRDTVAGWKERTAAWKAARAADRRSMREDATAPVRRSKTI